MIPNIVKIINFRLFVGSIKIWWYAKKKIHSAAHKFAVAYMLRNTAPAPAEVIYNFHTMVL